MYRRMCDVYREACFSFKKSLQTGKTLGFLLRSFVEKTVHAGETHRLSGKKKFPMQQLVKKIILTIFLDLKELFTTDFLEKGATVKSTFHC